MPQTIRDVAQLEAALSRPTAADIDFMSTLSGDVMVLGAGGKMGPSLAKLARRATIAAGVSKHPGRIAIQFTVVA